MLAAAAAVEIPAAAALAQQAFGGDQHGHNCQGHQRQQGRSLGIAIHLPAVKDSGGEAGHPQQAHGAQFIHHLHGAEGDAGPDRGQGDR